jgi:hypothetical protein
LQCSMLQRAYCNVRCCSAQIAMFDVAARRLQFAMLQGAADTARASSIPEAQPASALPRCALVRPRALVRACVRACVRHLEYPEACVRAACWVEQRERLGRSRALSERLRCTQHAT